MHNKTKTDTELPQTKGSTVHININNNGTVALERTAA